MTTELKPNPPTRGWGRGPIEGTEDWYEVVTFGDYDYSWSELQAWYSPSARLYFWIDGSGCSCYGLSDDMESIASFSHGDKDALARAIKAFAGENDYWADINPTTTAAAVSTVRRFKEPQA